MKAKVAGKTARFASAMEEGECEPPVATIIVKMGLDHFEVTAVPDTIKHLDTSVVKVNPKNKDDKFADIPNEAELNFLLNAAGQKYGKLVAPDGKGPTVNIIYGDVKKGKLIYVADGDYAIGDSAKIIEVSVVASENESKTGTGNIYIKPSIEPFCQGDSRWANTRYDNYMKKDKDGNIIKINGNPIYYGVGDKGCALTCMAMIAHAGGSETDPGKLADYMNSPSHYGFSGTGVLWNAADGLNGNSRYRYSDDVGKGLKYNTDKKVDLENSSIISLAEIDVYLNNGYLIVAQVYNPSTQGNHWVLVTNKNGSDYSIIDPGCYVGRTTLSNGYGNNIYRYIVYKRI